MPQPWPRRPMTRVRTFALLLVLTAASACAAPLPQPTSVPATVGIPYPVVLNHCGLLEPLDFDTRYWEAVGDVPDSATGAVGGTVTLLTETEALFAAERLDVMVQLRPVALPLPGSCV